MESKAVFFPPAIRLVGDLTVLGDARVACSLRGKVRVSGRLEVDPVAVVEGEIRSGSLRIERGATVKADLAVGAQAAVPARRRGLGRLFSFK